MMSKIEKCTAPLGRIAGAAAVIGVLALLASGTVFVKSAQARNVAHRAKDTCSLARVRDVSKIIGDILSDPTQDGPKPDDANPSVTNTRCQFDGENGHITVISNLFPSSEAAGTTFDQAIENVKAAEELSGPQAGRHRTTRPWR